MNKKKGRSTKEYRLDARDSDISDAELRKFRIHAQKEMDDLRAVENCYKLHKWIGANNNFATDIMEE